MQEEIGKGEAWEETNHGPIQLLQERLAIEANIDAGYKRAENLENNSDIVQTTPKIGI